MDYDENDFQSQNFQLVGEENKFPPSLRSFPLPKFDLDDHFQTHLRFNSLADTDVLLGIQSQENNWIEDFSSGTSAIEFSSSAADNRSISRHNNVWSEATSAESVEMLLRSVGEDEMRDKKAEAMEADALNVVNEMMDQVDPASRQGDDGSTVVGDIIKDPVFPPDKFQRKLSRHDSDASRVQSEVQGLSRISSDEISGAKSDASSLEDKFYTDRKSGAEQCMEADNVSLSSDDTSKKDSVISESLCNLAHNEEPLGTGSMKASDVHCWDASGVARRSPDSITCRGTHENLVEMHSVIKMTERSDLHVDDAQKERCSMSRDAAGNEQFLVSHGVESHHCTRGNTSFLESTRDSFVLMSERCNVIGCSEKPDGLLEAITYQVNSRKNDNKTGDKSILQANEMNSLENAGVRFIEKDYVDISKENIPNKLTDRDEKGIEHTSEAAVEANAFTQMNSETQRTETKNATFSEINKLGALTPGPASLPKTIEAAVIKDVEESACKLIALENVMFGKSPFSAVLNKTEVKVSSLVPGKVHNAVEQSDVHTFSLEASAGENYVETSTSSGITNLNSDELVVMGKTKSATSAGLDSDNEGIASVSRAKHLVHDGSAATKLTPTDVGLPSIVGDEESKQVTSSKLLEPDSICSDVKEVKITEIVSVSALKSKSDALLAVGSVITSDSVVTDSSPPREMTLDVPGVKVTVLDKTIKFNQSKDTSPADTVPEKKEGASSIKFSLEFIQSNDEEAKTSTVTSLTKSGGIVENTPLTEFNTGEHSSLRSTANPHTALLEQPLSYVETSHAYQRLQSVVAKTTIHEAPTAKAVEESLVIHDPPLKGKDDSNKSEASSHEKEEIISAETPSHCEGQILPATPSAEKNSAALVRSGINASTTLSESNGEAQLTVEMVKSSLPEPSCGSPTVISCCGLAQNESEVGNARRVQHTTPDPKKSIASEDDRTFTFAVQRAEQLSGNNTGDQWKSFAIMQSPELSKTPKETQGSQSEPVEGKHRSRSKQTSSEDKPTNEKLTTSKGRPAKRTTVRKKSTDRVGNPCATSSAPVGTIGSGMQLKEAQSCTESNHMRMSVSPIVQPSSMPDSNSSASTTSLVQQPFTDLQQIQLRAQIFVYGSLIQSVAPDEACMQSAFGATDAGRSSWEGVWRKSVERYQTQKPPVNPETPIGSHSVAGAPKQVTKCSLRQIKAVNPSSSRSVSKVKPPAILSSTPPLPSPLWSISTHDGLPSNLTSAQLDFSQALSPLLSYPSSQKRQLSCSSMPWLPLNPHPGPWAVSAQSSTQNATTQYSTRLAVETLQVTAVKESSMANAASSLLPTPVSAIVPPSSLLHLEAQKQTASPSNNKKASSIEKSRQRKKAASSEDVAEAIPVSQFSKEPASATTVSKTLTASLGLMLSSTQSSSAPSVPKILPSVSEGLPLYNYTPPRVASQPIVSATNHISPTKKQLTGIANAEQRVIVLEETGNKTEQAKLQAEDAAAFAASVVSHSQTVWNQLAAQRNTGLVTEVEEKLASAAVAAAAAASVAKAAAEAAKLASNAALQAKMMADEALGSATTGRLAHSSKAILDVAKDFTRLTPGSILKGKDKIHGSSSIISAAREAMRRRVEAASAATKRAENLDAIMKAAELAAEAVSQVGTIIAMGAPLPIKLSDLLEAGPDCSWKAYYPTSEKLDKVINQPEEKQDLDHRGHNSEQNSLNNRATAVEDEILDEQSTQSGVKYKGSGVGNPSAPPNDSQEINQSLGSLKENAIQKGSIVEVMPDKEGIKGGWFSARVVDLKDNEAYVCYNNLLSDDGFGQLKEWVSLDSESNRAPRIRIMHPMVSTKYARTRKRGRETVGSSAWAVGDRVDARMRDGWFEGIVTEKSQIDETKLTVHFPAGSDSSLVRAWDLRPSSTWKDGQWIEWSRARDNTGDTPHEKRPKLSRIDTKVDAEVDGTGISNLSKKMPAEFVGKAEESKPLNLSAEDTIFSVGNNASAKNISDALKGKRTGLRKEGSGVVFGVPKPGKKRKFMEVSKHYVSDKTNMTSQGADSLKFAKYLMPQASRPLRNTSKVDSRVKQGGDGKFVGVKSGKSLSTQTRSTSEKENPSLTTASNGEKNGHVSSSNMRTGFSKEEKSFQKNSLEVVSFPDSLQTKDSLIPPSVSSLPNVRASNKKSSAVETEQSLNRRPSPLDKSIRYEKNPPENHEKSFVDAVEPRRSNRRIQPTSRLLEGLESSLTISKIPTFSHDKSSKALHKGSRGNTRG